MKTEFTNYFETNPYSNSVLIIENHGGTNHYLQVRLNDSHNNGKLTKGDSSGLYHYGIKYNSEDKNPRNTSQPELYVTEESLKKARRILDKNFTAMKNTHALGKTFIHYTKMVEIVEDNVEHYKEDFYWHDIYKIGIMMSRNIIPDFYWMVGQSGTSICQYNDEIYNFYKNQRAKFYHVTDKTIREHN